MAQLQDIIAKREELMKAWNTNYTDAMAEARRQVTASQAPAPTPAPIAPQPIQPAPVTPTAPTAQVVPPQPIQPAPAQQTDWMGDFSQIKKREPVAPTAVTPEPVAPAQVTPTTPTNVKPEVPVINRQQEIQNNLATGYQTNPWLFTDRAAYDKAYNYATKSPEEQATLDSFYNSKQPTISSMYSAIVNKQEVPDSTKMTPAYKIAQNRYSKASSFSSMTPSQVSDQMRSAKLVEGSQAFEDLKAINPKLVQDATNLRKVNGDTTNIWTTNPDGTKVNNLEKSIADDYTDNFGEFIKTMYKVYTPAEITAIIRTPDVVAAEDKAFAIEKSINELDKQIANIDSEVDTEFKWSGATGSRLAMEKAARRDVLNKDRDSQVREYTTYANRASNLITQNTVSFQTQQQQQQAQNAAMLPFILDQYKTAQAKKQAEFELNDPATQIKATMDEFAKLWVTATGWIPWKVQEAKDWIAKWGTLDWYINQMRKDLMAKPEYIAQALKKANEWVSFQTIGDKVYKVKDGQLIDTGISAAKTEKWTFVKWENGNWINTTTKEIINENDLISSQTNDKLNTYLSNTPVWSKWGQCGSYANKNPVAVANWFKFGDSYQSKLDQTNSKEGAIGAFAVWNPGGVTKQYGHVGQVVGESQDGKSWLIRDSNFSNNPNDETVREHYVPKSVISSTGGAYAVPWIGTKSNTDFSSWDIALFNSSKYNPQTDKDKARAARYEQYQNKNAEIMSDPNASIIDKMKYSKWSKDLTESPNKAYKDMWLVVGQLGRLNQSIKDYDKKSWFGSQLNPIQGIISNANPWDTKAQEVKTQLIQLVPKIARGVFWEVGVLTKDDVANYIQTLPNIKQTADVQDVVQLALLSTLKESLDNSLIVDSATYDTSGLIWNYKKLDDKISELQSKVSWTPKSSVSSKWDLMTTLASIGSSLQNALSGIKK